MNKKKQLIIILHIFSVLFHVEAQTLGPDGDAVTNFQPSLAVVIGILSIMFSLTFLLLLYAKFCHRRGSVARIDEHNLDPGMARSASGLSGIDKTVIESLPFFRFSALRGSRGGLECAVCLSKFEEIEILRLLPKCKHAFHIDCVDQWLEKHSSCPLCRRKVCTEDVVDFDNSDSMRFLRNQSEIREDSNIELFVQREEEEDDNHQGSSRFSVGSSFRRIEKVLENDQETTMFIQDEEDDRKVLLQKHKHNHKIVVSDHHAVFKNRWSNVSSSDLMFLNSEMLNDMSSNRFSELGSTKDELQILEINNSSSSSIPILSSTSRLVDTSEKRSMSDITALSRFGDWRAKNMRNSNVREAKMRRLWLPIAKKTVEWFANREKRTQQLKNSTQPNISDV